MHGQLLQQLPGLIHCSGALARGTCRGEGHTVGLQAGITEILAAIKKNFNMAWVYQARQK